jgi:hypothetical protein
MCPIGRARLHRSSKVVSLGFEQRNIFSPAKAIGKGNVDQR